MINQLKKIKEEHGDINVIYGYSDYTAEYIEPVKYIVRYNEFIEERVIDTEDLYEDYLEEKYDKDDILDSGIIAKIY